MSTGPDRRVECAAEAIAEGRPADLNALPGDSAETAELFAGLRTVEHVARVHRRMQESGEAASDPQDSAPVADGERFRWGGFEVLEPIGAGSFARVFRARDPALGRDIALKLRGPDEPGGTLGSQPWLDEARKLARIRHANVVHVYGAAIHDGRAGIWMELVPGVTLAQWLATHGPMGWREACVVGVELCAALAAVHGAELVHNDVKLENVMRAGSQSGDPGGSGRIVLMDLGAGGRLGPASPGATPMGTPRATAPEVLLGGPASAASDLWSLGAVLYRLVTGRPPFDADTAAGLIEQARAGAIAPLRDLRPELPGTFVAVVERALSPDPSHRFASAAEFERALAGALDASTAGRAAVPRQRPMRTLSMIVAVAAVAALVAAGVQRFRAPAGNGDGATQRSARDASGDAGGTSPSGSHDAASGLGSSGLAPGAAVGSGTAAANPRSEAPVVSARFVRVTAAGAEPIADGDLVVPGDQLALEIETREPAWLYALNEDATGGVTALFPVPGLDLANPLPAGRHRLPGSSIGASLDWQVTSAGGKETFLFVASPRPLSDVERRIESAGPAHEGAAVEPPTGGDAAGSRGVAGLARTREGARGSTGALSTLARELERGGSGRLWLRRFELRNPGR